MSAECAKLAGRDRERECLRACPGTSKIRCLSQLWMPARASRVGQRHRRASRRVPVWECSAPDAYRHGVLPRQRAARLLCSTPRSTSPGLFIEHQAYPCKCDRDKSSPPAACSSWKNTNVHARKNQPCFCKSTCDQLLSGTGDALTFLHNKEEHVPGHAPTS